MVDIKEQLLAYLEGTLTPAQRREVVRRLATSHQWQQELENLQQSQSRLKREMPAFGCPTHGQLSALLPDILEKSKRRPSRLRDKFDWTQGGMLLCMVAVMMMMVPAIIRAQTAVLASTELGNVPHSTNTPSAIRASTLEVPRNAFVFVSRTVSLAARPVRVAAFQIQSNFQCTDAQRGLFIAVSADSDSLGSFENVGATPAPAPGSTIEPSLEAALEIRQ